METSKACCDSLEESFQDDDDLLLSDLSNEFILNDKAVVEQRQPWEDVLNEADELLYGTDDEVADPERALSLYKDAIRLGSLVGYEKVGVVYEIGEGVPKNLKKALDYYRTGAEKGNYYCWASMAQVFHTNEQDENATKCWKRFFDARSKGRNPQIEDFISKFINEVCNCCVYCMLENQHSSLLSYLRDLTLEVTLHCEKQMKIDIARGGTGDWHSGVKRWIQQM